MTTKAVLRIDRAAAAAAAAADRAKAAKRGTVLEVEETPVPEVEQRRPATRQQPQRQSRASRKKPQTQKNQKKGGGS